jgi:transposase
MSGCGRPRTWLSQTLNVFTGGRQWPALSNARYAVASEVARAAGIHTSQLFRWRQQLCERAQIPAVFNPVTVTAEAGASSPLPERSGSSSPEAPGVVEIEFAAGGRMRISGSVDASTVSALLKALVKGKRRR